MLISTIDERWSKAERIDFYLSDIRAIDLDSGAVLYASYGRRKSGRGTRYACHVPTGETRMGYRGTSNPRPVPVKRKAFTVTAHSEGAAIEQANKALARFLSKGPRWSDEAFNWTFQKEA